MPAPAWLDELDLRAGPPEAAMGTRALDERRWLLVDDDWTAQRDEARLLLANQRGDVLAGSARAAASEVGALIDVWLRTHQPDLLDIGPSEERDPLAVARSRVAEDLCVLLPDGERWVLAAGCVCFPSFWRLHDKVGRPLAFVHDPVPGYPGAFAARVDSFLGRLRPGQGVWRRNWSIHRSPMLFVPRHEAGSTVPAPEERWLRSEYQTLRRLTDADAVVFTIRTQQVPVGALLDRPDRAAALAHALRGWSPGQRAYKGGAVDDALLRWLDDVRLR